MKLLLDTHTAIWWLDAPEKLSRAAYEMIADPANRVLISPITPWEMAIKINSGKMTLHVLVSHFREVMSEAQFTLLPIDPHRRFVLACFQCIIAIHLIACWSPRRWKQRPLWSA